MKNNIYNKFSHQLLKSALCMTMIAGSVAVYAQTEVAGGKKVIKARTVEAPTFEMMTVTGRVIDAATKEPMAGVKIQVLGNSRFSTLTEEDGSYTFPVPVFASALYVYAPDYAPVQVAVGNGMDVNVELMSDQVKAFYSDSNTPVQSAKAEIVRSSSITVETDIQKQLTGDVLSVQRSGLAAQGAYMTIHGINSLNGNAQPMIVIDGNIVDMEFNRPSLHEGYVHNLLAGLDPEVIESVEVLKNATAIYGAKAGNGAIIIKTKRGKSMATKINVNAYVGFELAPGYMPTMKAEQYRSYLGDIIPTYPEWKVGKNSSFENLYRQFEFLGNQTQSLNYNVFHNETDWSKDMYRTAMTQNYKIGVEGGDERGMYSLQLGYTMGDSHMKNNDFNRLNLRFNTDINIFSRLFAEMDVAYNYTRYNVLDNGWSESYDQQNIGSPFVLGLVQAPFLSQYAYARRYNADGSFYLERYNDYAGRYASTTKPTGGNRDKYTDNPFYFTREITANYDNMSMRNPYWIFENGHDDDRNYVDNSQILLNFRPHWEINKNWTLSDRFHYGMYRNSERYFLPTNGANEFLIENLGYITSMMRSLFTKETCVNNDLRVDFRNQWGAHDLKAYAGWRYNNYSFTSNYIRGYNNENDKVLQFNSSMKFPNYTGDDDAWRDITAYIGAQYNYGNRYLVDFAMSAMSSSRFGNNTKNGLHMFGVSWGLFPSIQAGWLLSNEKWFPRTSGINFLKLTAGFELSGNDDIDYYASRTYWKSALYSQTAVGSSLHNIANSQIQWETIYRWNVGLQGSFLKNRLTAGLNMFWNRTADMLILAKANPLTGLAHGWTNDGEMTNRGFDININSVLINTKNWKWQLGASIGHYSNVITKLPSEYKVNVGGMEVNGYTSSVYGDNNKLSAVGYAAGSFFGYQTAGVFATTAEAQAWAKYDAGTAGKSSFSAGDVRFVDQNGDGLINEKDKVVIGNPNPDLFGSFSTSLDYKRLRLDVLFTYSIGNDVYNYQRHQMESGNNLYNQSSAMANRWTHEGQQTNMPRACSVYSEDWHNNERFSDRFMEDGSYLKLKNIRLTYTCPWQTSWLQGMKIWAEANNVFTATRYMGLDPEISCGNGVLYQGIDNGMRTLGRTFNLGLSINL